MGVTFGHRKAAERFAFGGYVSRVTARIFSASANSKRIDTMGQVKQAAACEIADKHDVKSEDDIANLEKSLKLLQSEVKSVKAELSNEQLKLKRVSDLIAAYEKIVEGNYIDRLIKAQKNLAQSRTAEAPTIIIS